MFLIALSLSTGSAITTLAQVEHQPRFYHWIMIEKRLQGTWRGRDSWICIGGQRSISQNSGHSGLGR